MIGPGEVNFIKRTTMRETGKNNTNPVSPPNTSMVLFTLDS
jgi:hypothetical protein